MLLLFHVHCKKHAACNYTCNAIDIKYLLKFISIVMKSFSRCTLFFSKISLVPSRRPFSEKKDFSKYNQNQRRCSNTCTFLQIFQDQFWHHLSYDLIKGSHCPAENRFRKLGWHDICWPALNKRCFCECVLLNIWRSTGKVW